MIYMNLTEFALIDIPDFLEVPIGTLAEIRQQIEDLCKRSFILLLNKF